jgi:hypothetical protein
MFGNPTIFIPVGSNTHKKVCHSSFLLFHAHSLSLPYSLHPLPANKANTYTFLHYYAAIFFLCFWLHALAGQYSNAETGARIYRPSYQENKLKTLVFYD